MQNPEQWIDMIAEPERRPFDPNPVLFPVTWIPLRLLQMVAVARVVSTDPKEYLWCPVDEGDQVPKIFGKFLLQLALCDEWYRVFIREKRVGLGIAVMIFYYFAMLSLLVSSAMLNGRATLLMVPSLVAIIVSGWMNIVIFWNRYETRRRKERNIPTMTIWTANNPGTTRMV
jgi:tryptophan-rich sensory protein